MTCICFNVSARNTFLSLTSRFASARIRGVASPQLPFYIQLGQRIREARRQRKFTQEKLAAAVQLTRTSITNIECGRQPVLAHHLVAFAKALGVTVESLLQVDEAAAPPKLDAQLQGLTLADEKLAWVKRAAKTPTN